jgi:glutamate/tyrosine decarboxylase-like PLP-dependent enzyme
VISSLSKKVNSLGIAQDLKLLELSPQAHRDMAQAVMETALEYWQELANGRPWQPPETSVLDKIAEARIPELPTAWADVLKQLRESIFSSQEHLAHPRFFAFVSNPNNFASCLADFLVAAHNPFVGSWLGGSGAQTIELALIRWLAAELGLPETAGGVFLSGGSLSNLAAIVTARQWRFSGDDWSKGIVYYSDQTHSSLQRALRILGFSKQQARVLPADADGRLNPGSFAKQVSTDREHGHVPFCLIGNAGTTNTGAVDPLAELTLICRQNHMWLHVDGAYGGAAALCAEGKSNLQGLELADSITLDPHKWLFQPYGCSCLLVRSKDHLRQAFHTTEEVLRDAEGAWNLWDYGPELTRPFRALKLWFSLHIFGASAFRQAIARGFELARAAEKEIRELHDWQIVSPARMAIVVFRYAPEGTSAEAIDRINAAIAARTMSEGFAFIASTKMAGRVALRMCTINPRTTDMDIKRTALHLAALAKTLGNSP